MRVLLFHNPSAGNGASSREALHSAFADAGFRPTLHSREHGPLDASRLAGNEMVVVAGGDGTVADAVRSLDGPAPPFSIVPLGTANNIATTLGISGTAREIARGLRQPQERALDIGRLAGVDDHATFLEAVGLGSFAASLAANKDRGLKGEEKIRAGRRSLAAALKSATHERVHAAVDGAALPEDVILLELMNTGFSGPHLQVAPSAEPGHGLLEVAILRSGEKQAVLAALEAESDGPLPLETIRGRRVRFTWGAQAFRVDDHFPEPPKLPREVSVGLADTPLRFLVPAPARRRSA